jgi:hypothetical protein
VSNQAGGKVSVEEQVVETQKGGYLVRGIVIAEMNHLVYLGFLVVIGLLIALPAMLSRVSGSRGARV